MLIRRATADDIPALEELIPQSVRLLSANYYTAEQIESGLTYIFGVDSQLITDGTYYVAETEGEIVGCGGWSKRRTLYGGDQAKAEVDSLLDPEIDAARIRAFFVHPDRKRQGIGSRIIETCERAAREAGFTTLELVATLPGEPLYKAFEYEVAERFEAVLPDGITLPLARMTKQVTGKDKQR
jgi:N-acetylglutamate synthase-like GNAT family acetyltransferase